MGRKNKLVNTSARKQMGIAQEDYVPFLWGITRSALAMYENHQRSLPFEPRMKNNAVELAFAEPETEEAREARTLQEKQVAREVLAKRREECLLLIKKFQWHMLKMQERYQQCLHLVRVAARAPIILTELLPNNPRHQQDMECLESFGSTGTSRMKKCSIGQQQLLQLKMDALQFEADQIQQLLTA